MLAQLELHAVEGTSVRGAHFLHRCLVLESRGQQVFQVGQQLHVERWDSFLSDESLVQRGKRHEGEMMTEEEKNTQLEGKKQEVKEEAGTINTYNIFTFRVFP